MRVLQIFKIFLTVLGLYSGASYSQAISDFTPSTIAAGTESVLTIRGSGFGSTGPSTTRYVEVRNADNGGASFIQPATSEYISWSDTEIRFRFPSGGGTGQVRVINGGTTMLSATAVTVSYNLINARSGGTNFPVRLANHNASGGYTFLVENKFNANTDARASFTRALENWKCTTGVNWKIEGTSAVDETNSGDGINIIRFDTNSELAAGTLGVTYSSFRSCSGGPWQLSSVDMVYANPSTRSWNFTQNAALSGQHDFETVVLHELGHAHLLGHVIDPTSVMHYAIGSGSVKRTLSPTNVEAGNLVMSLSTSPAASCFPPMIALTAGSCTPAPPFILSFTPTSGSTGTVVTITGTGFTDATAVTFGGVPGTNVQVLSATSVRARPAGGASGAITVTTPNGTASRTGFTFAGTGTAQTITMPAIPDKTFGDPDFAISATASSGLPVSFGSSNPSVAVITGNTVRIVGAGTAIITAEQNGNATFAAAPIVTRTLTVNKASQTITFSSLPSKNLSDGSFGLVATASSGLPITFTSSNENVAVIIGSTVSLVGPGTTNITASQPGNSNYLPATSVMQLLTVNLTLATNNFTVSGVGETCRNSNNGMITINAVATLSYISTVTGNEKNLVNPFTNSIEIKDLAAGNYRVCLTLTGVPSFKQCYDVVITEPKALETFTAVNQETRTVNLALSGGEQYTIELNGRIYRTTGSSISLPLVAGSNSLKVSTDKACQGVLEQRIVISNEVLVYPNPFQDKLMLNLGGNSAVGFKIEIRTLNGKLVRSGTYKNNLGSLELDLSDLDAGVYLLKVKLDKGESIHKIIKK